MKYIVVGVLTTILMVFAWALNARWSPPAWNFNSEFVVNELDIDEYDFFDFGVANIDGDALLDLYTANHSSAQSILFGDGRDGYLYQYGLGQVENWPGVEDSAISPKIEAPGIYIYRQNKLLNIVVKDLQGKIPDDGAVLQINTPWPLRTILAENANVVDSKASHIATAAQSALTVTLYNDSRVVLIGKQDILEVPHRFTIGNSDLLGFYRLGRDGLKTSSRSFTLAWKDRHAFLWGDVDGDGDTDVFIGRGGIKGQLNSVTETIYDEFLINQDGSYIDIAEEKRLVKGNCPARQAAWVDVNGDSMLDMHVSCGRFGSSSFLDRLYVRQDDGSYDEKASEYGLDYGGVSVFQWVDLNLDGSSDLISAQNNELVHLRNIGDSYTRETIISDLPANPIQIVSVDLDSDLDMDAFFVSRVGSMALINNNGQLVPTKPEVFGLPSSLRSIAFADYNNDGLIDAHSIPGGLHVNVGDSTYEKKSLLDDGKSVLEIAASHCNWYDHDNDGYLSLVCVVQRNEVVEKRIWRRVAGENTKWYWTSHSVSVSPAVSNENNWIQIDLRGENGNRQSVGASAIVSSGDRQWLLQVGQFEGSKVSHGHFRLYQGLGKSGIADNIAVFWPDGSIEDFKVQTSNQLVTLVKGTGVLR